MWRTILLSLFALLVASAANDACAQHRGGGGLGFARGGYHFSRARGGHAFSRVRGNYAYGRARGASVYGLAYSYLPYDSGGPYAYPAPEPVVFVQQPPVVIQPPAPPAEETPAEPVIKEYKWPAADVASSLSKSEPEVFAIVLKDGSTLSAVTIFASNDVLHYVDPDERHLRISMSEIDRAATLKLNRARSLNLYLPAPE